MIKETNAQRAQAQYIPCLGMLQADIYHVLVPLYLAGGGGRERGRKGRKERKERKRKGRKKEGGKKKGRV